MKRVNRARLNTQIQCINTHTGYNHSVGKFTQGVLRVVSLQQLIDIENRARLNKQIQCVNTLTKEL